MDNWLNYTFESDTVQTPEFKQFAIDFKKNLIKPLGMDNMELVDYNIGHFYVSGFLRNGHTGKYAYFSVSDVRHFPNDWHDHVLVRTAKDMSDYTGGSNNYCTLHELPQKAAHLTV